MKFKIDDPEIQRIFDTGDAPHRVEAWVQTVLSGRLTNSLGKHGEALTNAATASDRYSGRLVWATWALVMAAVVQILVILWRG